MSEQPQLKKLLDENGNLVSPQLPEEVKNYLIDIDGTITEDVPNEEPERMATCQPFADALETLNRWYEQGHIITFFTSRTLDHKEVTETWLANTVLNTMVFYTANLVEATIIGLITIL